MGKDIQGNVVGVVMSVGERTEALAVELLRRQTDHVEVIRNLPRVEATIKAYEIGLKYNYVVISGADILPFAGVVEKFLKEIRGFNGISGYCDSKFKGYGKGGIRLIKSEVLPKAIEILKNNKTAVRPDRESVVAMGNYQTIDINTGLHEYEQYYRDIFAKIQFQMTKYPPIYQKLPMFQVMAVHDDDFLPAVMALRDGAFSMKEERVK
jgi:hypothetical protein